MSHNLEIKNGVASFFSNKIAAWHRLGIVVTGAQTAEEAIKLANADWDVILENIYDQNGKEIPGYMVTMRQDTRDALGVVSRGYGVIPNVKQFEWMDKVLGEGGAHYETAGVLGKGERIFILANMNREYDIHGQGDIHKSYLAGVGSHDGKSSQRFFGTEVRIVCQNTTEMALSAAGSRGLTYAHKGQVVDRMMADAEVLNIANHAFDVAMNKMEEMALRRVDTDVVARTVATLFNIKDMDKDIAPRTANAILKIKELFEYNDGDQFKAFRGTAYNLYNSITEYADHYRPVRGKGERTEEVARAEAAVLGGGAEFKERALELILENTSGSPRQEIHKVYSVAAPSGRSILDDVLDATVIGG